MLVAGVDEAGRGSIAGPVVAAAVMMPNDEWMYNSGIKDSKLLTSRQREQLSSIIIANAWWGVGVASVEEIDEINILQASLLAMTRAVEHLPILPQHVLIDGQYSPKFTYSSEAIVGGDASVMLIAAASIVAKVRRDRMMLHYNQLLPQYDFAAHKGYGTAKHLRCLAQYGPCYLHRRSFAPVARSIA